MTYREEIPGIWTAYADDGGELGTIAASKGRPSGLDIKVFHVRNALTNRWIGDRPTLEAAKALLEAELTK